MISMADSDSNIQKRLTLHRQFSANPSQIITQASQIQVLQGKSIKGSSFFNEKQLKLSRSYQSQNAVDIDVMKRDFNDLELGSKKYCRLSGHASNDYSTYASTQYPANHNQLQIHSSSRSSYSERRLNVSEKCASTSSPAADSYNLSTKYSNSTSYNNSINPEVKYAPIMSNSPRRISLASPRTTNGSNPQSRISFIAPIPAHIESPALSRASSRHVSSVPQSMISSQSSPSPYSPLTTLNASALRYETPVATPPQLPFSPAMTLNYYMANLTTFEQQEIHEYPDIYFLGSRSIHKIGSSRRKTGSDYMDGNLSWNKQDQAAGGVYNSGYDDSRGDYYLIMHDHIAYRFEILSALGKGSFGQVVKCYDHKRKKYLALKIIRNKKRFDKQGKIEVQILDKLRNVDLDGSHNLVHMLDYFTFRGHLCLTFELLGANLYEWIKAGGFRGVNLELVRSFSGQILTCLSLMRQHRIIHCDLKPENLLLCDSSIKQPSFKDVHHNTRSSSMNDYNTKYRIKVIDFGSSCYEDAKIYTYVQSRFYRSPEVIFGITYNVGIDMWSLGCILAEIHTGYPLFPGENEHQQLMCIMEVLGIPCMNLVEKGTRRKTYFDQMGAPKLVSNSKGKKRKPGSKSLASVLNHPDPLFIDFMERCLKWDAEERLTPMAALRHEWMSGIPASATAQPIRSELPPFLHTPSSNSIVHIHSSWSVKGQVAGQCISSLPPIQGNSYSEQDRRHKLAVRTSNPKVFINSSQQSHLIPEKTLSYNWKY